MGKLEKLANLIDAILDQTANNEIKIFISRDKDDFITIVTADELSEIGSTYEPYTEQALQDAFEQLQSFVDEISNK